MGSPKPKNNKKYQPAIHLNNSFEILQKRGMKAFESYCNAVHMPLHDRETVLSKANGHTFIKSTAKLASGLFERVPEV
jgi:hypothetical protein